MTSTQPASIRITGDFIRGSSAIGILAIIIPLDTESNVIYSFRPRESTTALRDEDVSVPRGHYSVSLFVVEEVGVIFSRTASSPIGVLVDDSKCDCDYIQWYPCMHSKNINNTLILVLIYLHMICMCEENFIDSTYRG